MSTISLRKTIVVGGGVIGVTTAYELARRGHSVLLLEAREGLALETSFANGALLTASMPDPWNGPGIHRHLIASLFRADAATKLRLSAIPSLFFWGLSFLRHSSADSYWLATLANFRLASYSVPLTRALRDELDVDCDAADKGLIKVFRARAAMEVPCRLAQRLASEGLRFQVLDATGAIAIEPQLAQIEDAIAGALYFPGDGCGDALLFSRALGRRLACEGGEIRTRVTVDRVLCERGRVVGVESNAGFLAADKVIIAAGNGSARLAGALGIKLPIKPAKGYSVTLPMNGIRARPSMPIIDDAMHAAVVPLGDRLRLAGVAEFAGHDVAIRKQRIDNLYGLLSKLLPETAQELNGARGEHWTGLRPMSADGRPFIGPTPVAGLFVNTGHGHLGWTMAVGSSRLLADQIDARTPEISAAPFSTQRCAR